MSQEKPFVQIIIVTWNRKNDVLRLLAQLQKINYPAGRFAIMVVDNNSDDGTIEALERNFPHVEIIRNSTNSGGAGGFNAGMRWALEHRPESEFLWLLDNDVLVDPEALTALVDVLRKNPAAGMCGSKIINRDNHEEILELGAFINYRHGDVQRNLPSREKLLDPEAVFAVDYVAACSLLVRTEIVRQLGIWQENFFIYWDDMEWGVRFNLNGYKVLAANSSKVYHPSWLGRTVDSSAIWRSYYRIRNGLCFFNNYTSGIKRRLLLFWLILRYSRLSCSTNLRSQTALSRAVIEAINDFFKESYGKRDFTMPSSDISQYLDGEKIRDICLFISNARDAENARDFLLQIQKKYPGTKAFIVAPWETAQTWAGHPEDHVLLFNAPEKSLFLEKIKIINALRKNKWSLLLTGAKRPMIGSFWGKEVVSIDFTSNNVIAIEKFHFRMFLNTLTLAFPFIFKVIFSPPPKNLKNKT